MPTYENKLVVGNTGLPPDTLGHNPCWPEGLACDSFGNIYRVHGWDEAHHDIQERDPATGNVVWSSLQVIQGFSAKAICVEPDGSFAYLTAISEEGGKYRSVIFRIHMMNRQRMNFTVAGERIQVYGYGEAVPPTGLDAYTHSLMREPLNTIALMGDYLYVTDAIGGRVLKYHKVEGTLYEIINGFPLACGIAMRPDGSFYVGHDNNKLSYVDYQGGIATDTPPGALHAIRALSLQGPILAIADRYLGIFKYDTVSDGLSILDVYGMAWRPGDGDPERVREIYGMVQLPNGEIVFSDRVGWNGRTQLISPTMQPVWQQYGLEFVANVTAHPNNSALWISGSRNFYEVLADGTWKFLRNGQPESYDDRKYFGLFNAAQGQTKIIRHGSSEYLIFPAGNGVAIYLIEDGAKLQICGVLGGSNPNPDGVVIKEPWYPENRRMWQWHDKGEFAGTGTIVRADIEELFGAGNWEFGFGFASVCDDGMILFKSDSRRDVQSKLTKLPATNTGQNAIYKIGIGGTTELGDPAYDWRDAEHVISEDAARHALGTTLGLVWKNVSRADGDIYAIAYVNDPAHPSNDGQHMGGNVLLRFDVQGNIKWIKWIPFIMVGICAIPGRAGGCMVGTNGQNHSNPGVIYHYDRDGKQLHGMRPADQFGGDAPRIRTGSFDSQVALQCHFDPRIGKVRVCASDNLNQRIIVYDVDVRDLETPINMATVKLAWDAPASGAGNEYTVYQDQVEQGRTFNLTFTVSNVAVGTHQYHATARNSAGEGPASNIVTVNVVALPSAPQNLRLLP